MHDPWVDRRLAALDPPQTWQPDAARGLARLRDRQKAHRIRTRWTWAAVAASMTVGGLFLLAPAPCSGAGCSKSEQSAPAAAAPAPRAATPAPPAMARNYKESGSILAPVTVELYTDYECPHCATIYLQVMPKFIADYVKTGKVRLIHRDYPLAQHQYAKLAARYANAAGTLGYYEPVVNQIFRTQAAWGATGDIGTQVAHVLPPGVMDKVRNLVRDGASLDESVAADVAIGRQDQLNQTPMMAVVYKGKRQMLVPMAQYELLKSYFDELLAK